MPEAAPVDSFVVMTATTRTPTTHARPSHPAARAGIVVVASFLLGGVTSYAQGFLPDAFASFANSASGWTLLTALLLFWSRLRTAPAALLGAVSFVLLVLGYTVASQVRGYVYDPLLFSAVGVVAGPFVGVAASWLDDGGITLRGVRTHHGTLGYRLARRDPRRVECWLDAGLVPPPGGVVLAPPLPGPLAAVTIDGLACADFALDHCRCAHAPAHIVLTCRES